MTEGARDMERFDESVPLLLEQTQIVQPDAMSWFQLAAAYASLAAGWRRSTPTRGRLRSPPDYAVAMFDIAYGAPRLMKMGTIASPWRSDGEADRAPPIG
jgi:hypothetical protein